MIKFYTEAFMIFNNLNLRELPDPLFLKNCFSSLLERYEILEKELADKVAALADSHKDADATELSALIIEIITPRGIGIRYFLEEQERYNNERSDLFKYYNIYILQTINYAIEILEHAQRREVAFFIDKLNLYAKEIKAPIELKYRILPDFYKTLYTRFLESLVLTSVQYNPKRTDIIHTKFRNLENYSFFMAALYAALEKDIRTLYQKVEFQKKFFGLVWYTHQDQIIQTLRPTDINPTLFDWIILPSTPATNYALGRQITQNLLKMFMRFMVQDLFIQNDIRICIPTHSGLDEELQPYVEYSFLKNRFLSNTLALSETNNLSIRMIYEQFFLKRLVKDPQHILYNDRGLCIRNKHSVPLTVDGKCIEKNSNLSALNFLKIFCTSSGIAAVQQIDAFLRNDMERLQFTEAEKDLFFDKSIIFSFASASNIHLEESGTSVIDLTAYNDIRSIAGNTAMEYIDVSKEFKEKLATILSQARKGIGIKHSNDQAYIDLEIGKRGKRLLKYRDVFLLDDPDRLHDGHSLKNYIEACPLFLKNLLRAIESHRIETTSDVFRFIQETGDVRS